MANINVINRIEKVKKIVEQNYEPGNQSKCKLQALRKQVMDVYPMSERTFWRYMTTDVDQAREKAMNGQLRLNF